MRLIGDIGGTNARFALTEPGGLPEDEKKVPVADHAGLVEAAQHFLAGRKVEEAVLAVATPVLGDEIAFTNSPWRFSVRDAEERLGVRRLTVINDFVAQAAAIAGLSDGDMQPLKEGEARPDRPRVVLGPGTGLGIAFIDGAGRVLPSEAGHSSFAPQDRLQAEILHRLRAQFPPGHVSRERLLSGPGLHDLANALADIHGTGRPFADPKDVTARAEAGEEAALEALRLFSFILGSIAGDMALTLMADGGVFVTGGLARNTRRLLDRAEIARGFTSKGRFASFLRGIPIRQVMRPHTGLLGAAIYKA